MPMSPAVGPVLATLLILLVGSVALRRGMVRIGLPAAELMAPLCVGILMSPLLLGRIAPGIWERVLGGANDQRQALAELDQHRAMDLAALEGAGVTETAIEEFRERTDEQRSALQLEHDVARRAVDQLRRGSLVWVMAPVVLMMVGTGAGRHGWARPGYRVWGSTLAVMVVAGGLAGIAGGRLVDWGWWSPTDLGIAGCGLIAVCGMVGAPASRSVRVMWRGSVERREKEAHWVTVMCVSLVVLWGLLAGCMADGAESTFGAGVHGWVSPLFLCGLIGVTAVVMFRPMPWGLSMRVAVTGILVAVGAMVGPVHLCAAGFASGVLLAATSLNRRRLADAARGLERGVAEPLALGLIGFQLGQSPGFSVLLMVVVWICCGDGKALGALAGGVLNPDRKRRTGLREAAIVSAGGVVPILAVGVLGVDVLGERMFGSLVVALVLSAAVAGPAVRLIDRMAGDGCGSG